MIGILQAVQGPEKDKVFAFGRGVLTIGRGTTNRISLADPQVSRMHCEVRWEGERVQVTDLASAGGTWLNGKRLTATLELQPGDVLAVGETHLEFKWSREDEKPTTAWKMPNADES